MRFLDNLPEISSPRKDLRKKQPVTAYKLREERTFLSKLKELAPKHSNPCITYRETSKMSNENIIENLKVKLTKGEDLRVENQSFRVNSKHAISRTYQELKIRNSKYRSYLMNAINISSRSISKVGDSRNPSLIKTKTTRRRKNSEKDNARIQQVYKKIGDLAKLSGKFMVHTRKARSKKLRSPLSSIKNLVGEKIRIKAPNKKRVNGEIEARWKSLIEDSRTKLEIKSRETYDK